MSDQYPPPPPGGRPYGGQDQGGQYGGGQYGGGQYGSPSSGGQYGGSSSGQYESGSQYGGSYGGSSSGQYGSPPPPQPPSGSQYGAPPPGGQYGSPPPPTQFEASSPSPPPKKSAGRKVLGILGVIAVGVVIALLKFGVLTGVSSALGIGKDKTAEAKAGDCIASLPEVAEGQEKAANDAKVVGCDSPDAKFSVLGRLDNQTSAQAAQDKVCDAYPEAEYRFSAIPSGGKGYVLCLKELKPKGKATPSKKP